MNVSTFGIHPEMETDRETGSSPHSDSASQSDSRRRKDCHNARDERQSIARMSVIQCLTGLRDRHRTSTPSPAAAWYVWHCILPWTPLWTLLSAVILGPLHCINAVFFFSSPGKGRAVHSGDRGGVDTDGSPGRLSPVTERREKRDSCS